MERERREEQIKKRIKISAAMISVGIAAMAIGIGFCKEKEEDVSSVLNKDAEKSAEISQKEVFISIPYLTQAEQYPTGCECVSATMLLQFWGYSYTVDDVIKNFLPMGELKTTRRGELVGPSPDEVFIGNPYRFDSYGCYAPVIYDVLSQAVSGEHEVENLTGMSITQICEEYLDEGIPVLCWATIEMNPSYEGTKWRLEDGTGWFTWKAQEHCMVLAGYNQEYYYFYDPYENNEIVQWDRSLVETRYEEMGSQAVVVV